MRVPKVTITLDPRAYLERIHCSSGVDLGVPEPSLPLLASGKPTVIRWLRKGG